MATTDGPSTTTPKARVPSGGERGVTGLEYAGGMINEEALTPLRWPQAVRTYRQMADNDAVVGAVLYGIDMLIRNVDWSVEPYADKTPDDVANARWLETVKDDMSHSWSDFVSEALSMLPFGFAPHEIVYKRRAGANRRPGLASQYDDGTIGWRKLPIRAQDSVERWEFDDEGGIEALEQIDPNQHRRLTIPIEKLLLFRPRSYKNNPQGQSILRSAWRGWTIKKTIEEYEAIRVERDATGVPVAWVPPEITLADADDADQLLFSDIKRMVRNLKFNEQAGVVMPLAYDDAGNKLFNLELLQMDNRTMVDTDKVIQRWDSRIAMTALADFILIGHTSATGSYSLVSSRTNLFAYALGAYVKSIADVLNRHGVPRLWRLNGLPMDRMARFVPGDIESVDLNVLGTFIQQLAGAGAPLFPDRDLETALLETAGLPAPPRDDGALGSTTVVEPGDGAVMEVAANGEGMRFLLPDEVAAVDTTKGTGHLAAVDPATGWAWHVGGGVQRAGGAVGRLAKARQNPNLVLARHVGMGPEGDVYQSVTGNGGGS